MSVDRHDLGAKPKVPMVPRVTSARQRVIEETIAAYVVLEIAHAESGDFSAIVRGIQSACADRGIVLTDDPLTFAPGARS